MADERRLTTLLKLDTDRSALQSGARIAQGNPVRLLEKEFRQIDQPLTGPPLAGTMTLRQEPT